MLYLLNDSNDAVEEVEEALLAADSREDSEDVDAEPSSAFSVSLE